MSRDSDLGRAGRFSNCGERQQSGTRSQLPATLVNVRAGQEPPIARISDSCAADVVGYSNMMAEDEAGTLQALKGHRKTLLEPVVASQGGRIVKLMGDGALVDYPSIVEAIGAAVEIQRALLEHAGPIRLRIGVSLGDMVMDGDDICGEGVNLAARLERLAEPGGICISSVVHASLGQQIAAY